MYHCYKSNSATPLTPVIIFLMNLYSSGRHSQCDTKAICRAVIFNNGFRYLCLRCDQQTLRESCKTDACCSRSKDAKPDVQRVSSVLIQSELYKMKSVLLPFLMFTALTFLACGNGDHTHHQQGETSGTDAEVVSVLATPDSFRSGFATALEAYFDLKDALVETDADAASQKAVALADRVNEIDDEGLAGEAREIWEVHFEAMLTESLRIVGEGNVEEQRARFEPLSEAFIETVKRFQPVGYTVYEQMCPMVRGGQANWLSREEQIANPYHGDRMLRCGSVVARI
jgi:hypothetical protein